MPTAPAAIARGMKPIRCSGRCTTTRRTSDAASGSLFFRADHMKTIVVAKGIIDLLEGVECLNRGHYAQNALFRQSTQS